MAASSSRFVLAIASNFQHSGPLSPHSNATMALRAFCTPDVEDVVAFALATNVRLSLALLIPIALSLLSGAFQFAYLTPSGVATTLRVVISLSFALTPAIMGLAIAGPKWAFQRWRGTPTKFVTDWSWAWGVLMVIVFAAQLPKLIR
jgi:hypothetical protein